MRSLTNEITITARERSRLNLKELWLYRELFFFFAWRDIKVRYKQTVIGAGWAILQPLLAAAIFTLFFNRVAKIGTGSSTVPYPVFAYLGLMYWNGFAGSLSTISNSIVANQGVVNKVYFPRIIAPLSGMIVNIVDFFFAGVVFILLLAGFRVMPNWQGVLMTLPSLILIMVFSLGLGLYFAALNVKYRDVRSALPFFIQLGFFVTPVIYPLSMVPERFQVYTFLNPATGAISSVKSLLFGDPLNGFGLLISWVVALLLLLFGLWYFLRNEKGFVDIV